MRRLFTLIFFLAIHLCCSLPTRGQNNFDLVTFMTSDGGMIEAAFFRARSERAVVFAHGAVFNKESWYFLAEELQARQIAALPIDFRGYGHSKAGTTGNKSLDILAAIDWLVEQGYTKISIIGGSMGGAAVLEALPEVKEQVAKVVLLSPAGGAPIKSGTLNKLFIVSTEEGLYPRVARLYKESASPKEFKEFAGTAHAQHMFKEDYAGELTQLIIDFFNR